MQIGEEQLALAQHLAFLGLRLLHLHDHLGLGEDLLGAGGDAWRRRPCRPCRRSRCRRRRRSAPAPCGRDATSSRTLAGIRPTRYSWVLISLGTPISIDLASDWYFLRCQRNGPPERRRGAGYYGRIKGARQKSQRRPGDDPAYEPGPQRQAAVPVQNYSTVFNTLPSLSNISSMWFLLDDQRRRQRDDVAGGADQQAVLVAFEEGFEGALARPCRAPTPARCRRSGRDCAGR